MFLDPVGRRTTSVVEPSPAVGEAQRSASGEGEGQVVNDVVGAVQVREKAGERRGERGENVAHGTAWHSLQKITKKKVGREDEEREKIWLENTCREWTRGEDVGAV